MHFPDPSTPEQKAIYACEAEIRDLAKATPGVTFGYIGNFERWGDDRSLYLWIDARDQAGQQVALWNCNAARLRKRDVAGARHVLRIYRLGYEAGLLQTKTTSL